MIEIVVGDITTLDVDAIVKAANEGVGAWFEMEPVLPHR